MDPFFPEKILGEIFWDDPLPSSSNQSTFVQFSDLPRNESCELGSNSQNTKDEKFLPENQSKFPQYTVPPRLGIEPESSFLGSKSMNFSQYQRDFVQYRDLPRIGFGHGNSQNGYNSQNMNKKIIEFLRKGSPVEKNKVAEHERERSFRHMINERMRRQRQRQCCLALHSVLPYGTKIDNNSVVLMAAKEIQRLEECKNKLQRENYELANTAKLKALESEGVVESKMQLRVLNPKHSGMDSLVEALRCLKDFGVNTRSIKSNFSHEEYFALLEIETDQVVDAEVESAIQRRTNETERSFVRTSQKLPNL